MQECRSAEAKEVRIGDIQDSGSRMGGSVTKQDRERNCPWILHGVSSANSPKRNKLRLNVVGL